jgi:hypothetical protein
MHKHVLIPARLRRPPAQFSWVDQRLVREGHIRRCRPEALALYLFLVTVADARGLSYYGDVSVCRHLSLSPESLTRARAELMATGLIAWVSPLYQVLALDPVTEAIHSPNSPRHGAPRSIAACLRQALEAHS